MFTEVIRNEAAGGAFALMKPKGLSVVGLISKDERAAPLLDVADLTPDVEATAFFLDLDGTLAAFELRPELVAPSPRRTAAVRALRQQTGGRVAILSGRALAEVDRILEHAAPAAAGVHGLERRTAQGAVFSAPVHPGLFRARQQLEARAAQSAGLLLELKAQSVALHYRAAPVFGEEIVALAARIAEETGLVVQTGRFVAELRTPGADKGDALRAFMSEAPFSGARPVMIGDDFTDEHAFAAAAALGGVGVLVGPARPTKARYRAESVEDVLAWIERVAGVQTYSPEDGRCPA
jgi:trehalose 6-phosphate phosphatase